MKTLLIFLALAFTCVGLHAQTAEEWYAKGLSTVRKTNLDTNYALRCFDNAIKLNERTGQAFKWRSYLHELRGNDSAALEDITKYLQYASLDAKAFFRRAVIRERLKMYAEAINDISTALRYAENETDSTIFLTHRIELHDTLAANDRKQLSKFQQQKEEGK